MFLLLEERLVHSMTYNIKTGAGKQFILIFLDIAPRRRGNN
jgi:hypothetical protein